MPVLVWVLSFNQFYPCCVSSYLCDGDRCGALHTFITSRIDHCYTIYIGIIFGHSCPFWMNTPQSPLMPSVSLRVTPALDFLKQQIMVPWRTIFEKWGNVQPKQSEGNQETRCLKKNPAAILREGPFTSHIPIFSHSVKIWIDEEQLRVLATTAIFYHSARFSPMYRNHIFSSSFRQVEAWIQ